MCGESVSVGIDPLAVLAGRLRRVLGYVLERAALLQEKLLADWALVAANHSLTHGKNAVRMDAEIGLKRGVSARRVHRGEAAARDERRAL